MHQRFAAGDGDHGGAAFIHGFETFFGRKVFLENVRRVLDFAAARAGQVAAEQRLQHQDQRVALAAFEALLEDVGCYGPHLRDWHWHK